MTATQRVAQAQSVREVAYRFLEAAGERPFPPDAVELARSAFILYALGWDCHPHHLAKWEWPINTVLAGEPFEGDEPWTVLLRRCVEILHAPKNEEVR